MNPKARIERNKRLKRMTLRELIALKRNVENEIDIRRKKKK